MLKSTVWLIIMDVMTLTGYRRSKASGIVAMANDYTVKQRKSRHIEGGGDKSFY